jgi:hypothetical protein
MTDFGLEELTPLGESRAVPIQIIFLHGLGGSKRGTWTHAETNWFWPERLASEKGFDGVRIALFGYDANFSITERNTIHSIRTFADQLLVALDQLRYRTKPVNRPVLCFNLT